MINIWNRLGLEGPTDDIKAIKKAYAKKLRNTRPDDDPEGFMALRSALEDATYYARYQAEQNHEEAHPDIATNTPPPSDCPNPEINSSNEIPVVQSASVTNPRHAIESDQIIAPTPMDEVTKLIKDPFGRSDIQQWTRIFEDPRLEGIDAAIDFEENFRIYLLDTLGYFDGDPERHNMNRKPKLLSTRVGNHIFKTMGWRDMQGRPFYVQDQLDWLRQDLDVVNRSKPQSNPRQSQHIDIIHANEDNGISAWKIALGLVVIINVIRLLIDNFS